MSHKSNKLPNSLFLYHFKLYKTKNSRNLQTNNKIILIFKNIIGNTNAIINI